MQVSNIDTMTNQVVIGGGEAKAFGISHSAELLKVLSSTLYRDKITATAREIICNGWDSHIVSGITDTPIEITLTDAELIIRDFGKGIPQYAVESNYCEYGGTTKLESTEETGGFGLGSKAPFAYTEHFSIVNCNSGKKVTYAISRGDIDIRGMPSIREMSSVDTKECGVAVHIPIRGNDDRHKFKTNIAKLVYFGGINATFNGEKMETIDYSGDSEFTMVQQRGSFPSAKVLVKYGSVTYETSSEDEDITVLNERLGEFVPNNCVLIFKAKPNSIGVVPSREALSFSENTIETFSKMAIKYCEAIEDRMGDMIKVVVRREVSEGGLSGLSRCSGFATRGHVGTGFTGDSFKINEENPIDSVCETLMKCDPSKWIGVLDKKNRRVNRHCNYLGVTMFLNAVKHLMPEIYSEIKSAVWLNTPDKQYDAYSKPNYLSYSRNGYGMVPAGNLASDIRDITNRRLKRKAIRMAASIGMTDKLCKVFANGGYTSRGDSVNKVGIKFSCKISPDENLILICQSQKEAKQWAKENLDSKYCVMYLAIPDSDSASRDKAMTAARRAGMNPIYVMKLDYLKVDSEFEAQSLFGYNSENVRVRRQSRSDANVVKAIDYVGRRPWGEIKEIDEEYGVYVYIPLADSFLSNSDHIISLVIKCIKSKLGEGPIAFCKTEKAVKEAKSKGAIDGMQFVIEYMEDTVLMDAMAYRDVISEYNLVDRSDYIDKDENPILVIEDPIKDKIRIAERTAGRNSAVESFTNMARRVLSNDLMDALRILIPTIPKAIANRIHEARDLYLVDGFVRTIDELKAKGTSQTRNEKIFLDSLGNRMDKAIAKRNKRRAAIFKKTKLKPTRIIEDWSNIGVFAYGYRNICDLNDQKKICAILRIIKNKPKGK